MICKPCGYEYKKGIMENGDWGLLSGDEYAPFIPLSVETHDGKATYERTYYTLFVCPKCGTVHAVENF